MQATAANLYTFRKCLLW